MTCGYYCLLPGVTTFQAELIAFEDEAARSKREDEVTRQEGIKEALKKETSVFFCECCNKQYVKITEWENHLRWQPPPHPLHLAPCTLHRAPCALHPAPCTLHPAPTLLWHGDRWDAWAGR